MTDEKDKIEYVSDLSAEAPEGAKAEEKIKKAKDKLKVCEHERAEYLAGWQRAKADYINLQREHEQKIADYFKFANEGLILELLPILDSFEAAIKNDPNPDQRRDGQDGILHLYNQLLGVLKNNGLEEIKALGEKFDPVLHEVIEASPELAPSKVEGQGRGTELTIIEEIQKGYKLHNKVIRASKVKIGK